MIEKNGVAGIQSASLLSASLRNGNNGNIPRLKISPVFLGNGETTMSNGYLTNKF